MSASRHQHLGTSFCCDKQKAPGLPSRQQRNRRLSPVCSLPFEIVGMKAPPSQTCRKRPVSASPAFITTSPRGKEQMAEAVLALEKALIQSAVADVAKSPEPLRAATILRMRTRGLGRPLLLRLFDVCLYVFTD